MYRSSADNDKEGDMDSFIGESLLYSRNPCKDEDNRSILNANVESSPKSKDKHFPNESKLQKLLEENYVEILYREWLSSLKIIKHLATRAIRLQRRVSDWSSNDPLVLACAKNDDHIMKVLIEDGANINLCNEDGFSLLHLASVLGFENIVRTLLKYNADVNLYNVDGLGPLHIASLNGNVSIAQMLLDKGADLNFSIKHDLEPLHCAIMNNQEETARLLLEKGVDPNRCRLSMPLHMASSSGFESIVKLLLEKGPS